MLSGVPNFVFTIGYTNASWTLKADLVADYVVPAARATWTSTAPRGRWRRRDAGGRASGRSWTSPPATSCARSTRCPSRATGSRGGCGRTTCTTCARSAAAPIDDGVLTLRLSGRTFAGHRDGARSRTSRAARGGATYDRRLHDGFRRQGREQGRGPQAARPRRPPARPPATESLEAEGKGDQARPRSRTPARRSRTPPRTSRTASPSSAPPTDVHRAGPTRALTRGLPSGRPVPYSGTSSPSSLASGSAPSACSQAGPRPSSWRLRFSSSVADGTSLVRHTTRE